MITFKKILKFIIALIGLGITIIGVSYIKGKFKVQIPINKVSTEVIKKTGLKIHIIKHIKGKYKGITKNTEFYEIEIPTKEPSDWIKFTNKSKKSPIFEISSPLISPNIPESKISGKFLDSNTILFSK